MSVGLYWSGEAGRRVAHAHARPLPASLPGRACGRVHARGRSGNGAAGPRVRAASGSGCESGSGRLEPGAGRGPGSSVRRRRRRRRLGRRVEASGARSVGWWLPLQAARAGPARVSASPHPAPRPLLPSPTAPSPPSLGAAGPLPRSYLRLPTLTALVSPSPVRGSRRHDPARGEQPHHRGDARAQVRERGRRVSARPEEAELTLAKSRVASSSPALEGRDRGPGAAFRVPLAGWTWEATGRGEPRA